MQKYVCQDLLFTLSHLATVHLCSPSNVRPLVPMKSERFNVRFQFYLAVFAAHLTVTPLSDRHVCSCGGGVSCGLQFRLKRKYF